MAEVREVPMENIEIETRQEGEDEERVIVMYPAVFNQWSQDLGGFRERVLPGSFEETILQDNIIAAFNHDDNQLLGRNTSGTLELEEDARGLRAVIDPPDGYLGDYVINLIERGDIEGGSFRFEAEEEEWRFTDNAEELDERELEKCRLIDVGPVTHPAYPDTEAEVDNRNLELRSAEEVHQKAKEKVNHGGSRGFSIEKRKLEIMELEN